MTDQPEWRAVHRSARGWGFILFIDRATGRMKQVAGAIIELRIGDLAAGVEVAIYDGDVYLDSIVIDADTYTVYVADCSEALVRGYLARQREIDEQGPQGQLRMDV